MATDALLPRRTFLAAAGAAALAVHARGAAIHRLHVASGAYRKWQFDEHVTAMARRGDGTITCSQTSTSYGDQ